MTISSVTSMPSLAYQLSSVHTTNQPSVAAPDRETAAENSRSDTDDRPPVRGATFSTYA